MFFRLFGWFFKTFTPYILGVCIGVGFFFLLVRFTAGPVGMSWNGDNKADNKPVETVKQEPIIDADIILPDSATVEDGTVVANINAVAESQAKYRAAYFAKKSVEKTERQKPDKTPSKVEATVGKPDPIETDTNAKTVTKVASKIQNRQDDITPQNCGAPPSYPGVERNRFIACQWRNNCLASRLRAKSMFARGRSDCVMSGRNPVACRDYFDSMEKRNDPRACNRLQSKQNATRW
ncbi:MAG: hypothetical protein HQL69_13390 [Magnetococcales bacterium]|nr:hypothetical protein [Magnetococcales bacterium]